LKQFKLLLRDMIVPHEKRLKLLLGDMIVLLEKEISDAYV
jgi:hypothetical protein